ncbi:MAG: Smr/MutS family protein [Bacteroidales bacterium]|jgi:dsDNA-specific endonuclease/ATPase MutS2|nr:Smr/MutS family protein [Bacteroidales bacterium]
MKPGTGRPAGDSKRQSREVDLHLKSGYNGRDAVDRQLARIKGEMDSALRTGVREIIFIHGVGSGKLKKELRRVISEHYPSCSYHDAPFARYGYGAATVVVIRN